MARASDSPKVLEWQRRMARFEQTQRTVVEFCRDEGVSTPSFYQWRKKLAQRPSAPERSRSAETSFTPVRVIGSPGVAVQLPGGTQLQLPTADSQALELMLQTLIRADAERAGGK